MTTSNVISIEAFEAEYSVKQMDGGESWFPCRVVGVADEGARGTGRFLIITADEEGSLYAGSAAKVRRVDE